MKRLLISIFTLCVWIFGLHAQSGEFDPANPGDPQPYYSLTVQVSPAAGGTANITHQMVEAGKTVSLLITSSSDFRFVQWVCGEEVLSNNTSYKYTMPARNVIIIAQMEYVPKEFNPTSPGDPEAQEPAPPKHKVTVYTSPSVGGTVNVSSLSLAEGKTQNIYAYNNAGYEFVGWYVGDKLESSSNPVTLTMHKNDVALTARFRFNPVSPEDPSVNFYNEAAGLMIIDRFAPGQLSNAAYSLVGSSNYDKITSLIVVGEMNASDYGIIYNFNNLEVVDLSHTTGYTEVPSWAFESRTKLTRILLPPTVETIGSNAFYNCSGLKEMVLYTLAPPTAQQNKADLFYNVSEDLIVRVPVASMALYQASDLWNSFTILPMDVQSLNVTLPKDKLALYENMFLELLDTKNGQLRRYVITQRDTYSFSGIFDETTYQLTLRNAQNKVFGQEMVTFSGKDTTVTFVSLLQPVNLYVRVLNEKGEDLSAHATVTWMDGDGKYLNKGTSLTGQVEGEVLYYQWMLDEKTGTIYQKQDTAVRVLVDKDNNVVTDHLQRLPLKTVTGIVKDSTSNMPISGASIVITQLVNGKYNKIFNASSNNDGSFNVQLIDAPFEMVVTATNYKRLNIDSKEWPDNNQLKLTELSGAKISYGFQYIPAVTDGEEATAQNWYQNYNNVEFALFNVTKNISIDKFEIQYPCIILFEDVPDGDELLISVSGRANDFIPVQKTVVLNKQTATVTFDIVEPGKIQSSFSESENETVVGCLYDINGKLVKSSNYLGHSLTISNLKDGYYTLVTMGKSDFFNSMYDLKSFTATNLVVGTDYVTNLIDVRSGKINEINIDTIPTLDESKLYYTGNSTSYTTSKPSVVIGNYLTFTGRLDFKQEYATAVSNIQLVMDIPEGCSFVENSVMVGNNTGGYTLNENQVIVPLTSPSARVRFCVIPTLSGTYSPSAYVQFDLNGKTITQPIGAANFTAQALSISVPSVSATTTVTISGTALGKSDVDVYDNGVLIGHTSSTATGAWSMQCELVNAYNLSTHSISAKIKSFGGLELESETMNCVYDKNAIQISKVTMYHYNQELNTTFKSVFDFINPSSKPNRWTVYYPNKKFSYTIEFTDNSPEKISNVILYVHAADGQIVPLETTYDEQKKCWVTDIDMGNRSDGYYPVNVSVDYEAVVEPVLDAELFRDLFNAYSQSYSFIKEETKEYESLYQQWESANDIGNDEMASLLLQQMIEKIGYSNTDLLAPKLDDATLQQLISETALYEDSLANVMENLFNPNIYENDLFREYMNGITILTTEGITREQLINEGYQEIEKSDNSYYYILYNELGLYFVDFETNLFIIANTKSGAYACIQKRAAKDVDWAKAIQELGKELNKWVGAVQTTLDGVVERLYKLNEKNGMLLEEAQKKYATRYLDGLSRQEIKALEKDMTKYANAIQRNDKIAASIEKNLGELMSGASKTSKVAGKVFSIFNLGMDVWEGIQDVTKMQNMHDIITPPCDDAISAASKLKSDVHGWVDITGGYYVTKITSDIAEVCGIAGGIAGLIPSGGTSATAIAAAIAVVAANLAAEWIFKSNYEKAYNKFRHRYRELYWLCHREPCDGKYPCPPDPDNNKGNSNSSNGSGGQHKPTNSDDDVQIDPSGFVYEGVENNRIEGVTATIYYKDTHENMFGEQVEEDVLWNAEEYEQENPLYTDAQGMYRWDVPQGLWQVRFEKEGYEPTQSEWLPVPPPQLEVNIPIVQLRQPEVINAVARKDAIDITFDKFMMPDLLNTDNIFVTANSQVIEGSITLLDKQQGYGEGAPSYVSKVRFVPTAEFTAPQITLTVSNRVHSYADVPMAQTFQQDFDVEGLSVITKVQMPTASVPSGTTVVPGTGVSLSCATEGAVIRYTMDGTTPDCLHGYIYNGTPILLSGTDHATIYAIACADGYDPSDVAQLLYTLDKNATEVEQVPILHNAIKTLEGGHLFIQLPDGQVFNANGIRIK